MSTEALNRHLAVQERIDRAKEMVRRAEEAAQAMSFGDSTLGELDVEGHVRRSVRALLPLAAKDPTFDVTVTLGTERDWGVRVHNVDHIVQLAAVCLRGSAAEPDPENATAPEGFAEAAGPVAALAEIPRQGEPVDQSDASDQAAAVDEAETADEAEVADQPEAVVEVEDEAETDDEAEGVDRVEATDRGEDSDVDDEHGIADSDEYTEDEPERQDNEGVVQEQDVFSAHVITELADLLSTEATTGVTEATALTEQH